MKKLISTERVLLKGLALLFVTILIAGGCKKTTYDMPGTSSGGNPPSAGPGTNEVFIQGLAFDPATITVPVNTAITWKNKDSMGHTVTSDAGAFASGTLGLNGTYSHTFTTAGTYPYHCALHTYMTAVVIVN